MRGALLGFCLFLAAPSFAQTTAATLTGVVRDQDGGVIPGAQVTAVFGGRAYRRTTLTGGVGRDSLPALPPGLYSVRISSTASRRSRTTRCGSMLERRRGWTSSSRWRRSR